MKLIASIVGTPIGPLFVALDEEGALVRLEFGAEPRLAHRDEIEWNDARCGAVREQLIEYFEGRRTRFDIRLNIRGTDFQKRVWSALLSIPYGETTTYGDIARRIGNEKAVRAVGLANGSNPIAIVVPCHRVIGSNGSLTGYGGGLPIKERLLALEAAQRALPW